MRARDAQEPAGGSAAASPGPGTRRAATFARHSLILGIVYIALYALLFTPWNGSGFDEVYYHTFLSSAFFDGDVDICNDLCLARNDVAAIRNSLQIVGPKGLHLNMFAIGSAILRLPFHLPVWAVARVANCVMDAPPAWTTDRFSAPYLFPASLASLVYGYLALLLVYSSLRVHFRARTGLLATLGAMLASPFLGYALCFGGMSHALSAFSTALLVYVCLRHRSLCTWRSYVLIGGALALVVLVRWQDAVYGLLPAALWMRRLVTLRRLRSGHAPRVRRCVPAIAGPLLAACVFAGFLSIQHCYWRAQLGSFLTVPQGSAYMKWASPEVLLFLFSGWHGLFYTHPLLLPAAAGLLLYFARWKNPLVPLAVVVCVGVSVYVSASVSDYFGGASFGARRFCSVLPLLALGLASLLRALPKRLHVAAAAAVCLAIAVNALYLAAYVRRMFDVFHWHEILALGGCGPRLLAAWLPTVPLTSWFAGELLFGAGAATAMIVMLVGVVLVLAAWHLAVRGAFRRLEMHACGFAAVLLLLVLFADAMLLATAPPANSSGQVFAIVAPSVPASPEDKARAVRHALEEGYSNPAAHMCAVDLLGDVTRLDVHLDAVRRVSPKVWLEWIAQLPPTMVSAGQLALARTERARLPRQRPSAIDGLRGIAHDAGPGHDPRKRHEALTHAVHANPFDFHSRQALIDLLKARGDTPEAGRQTRLLERTLNAKVATFVRAAKRTVPWHRQFFEYYRAAVEFLGQRHMARGEFADAQALYRRMMKLNVADTGMLEQMWLLKSGLTTDTLAALCAPGATPSALTDAAASLVAQGKIESAIAILKKTLRSHPHDNTATFLLNTAIPRLGFSNTNLELIVDKTISSPAYRLALAGQLIAWNHPAEAEAAARAAHHELPDDPWANFILGQTLHVQRRYDEAEPLLRRAYDKNPDYTAYVLFHARNLVKLGRMAEARHIVARALERTPGGTALGTLKHELDAGHAAANRQ